MGSLVCSMSSLSFNSMPATFCLKTAEVQYCCALVPFGLLLVTIPALSSVLESLESLSDSILPCFNKTSLN